MTPDQCRMARAAARLGVRDLAVAAKVSTNTITRFEGGEELRPRTIEDIRRVLEAAGVQFLDNGSVAAGPGVALK